MNPLVVVRFSKIQKVSFGADSWSYLSMQQHPQRRCRSLRLDNNGLYTRWGRSHRTRPSASVDTIISPTSIRIVPIGVRIVCRFDV
jgi:hypothetical protein